MSLAEFFLRINNYRKQPSWIPASTFAPLPGERYSLRRLAASILSCVLLGALAGLFLCHVLESDVGMYQSIGLNRWILESMAEVSVCSSAAWFGLSCYFWNRQLSQGKPAEIPTGLGFQGPWTRRFLLLFQYLGYIVLYFAFVVILIHVMEGTRGKWTWYWQRRKLELQGESLSIDHWVPAKPSSDDNFFGSPFWCQFEYEAEPTDTPIPGTQNWKIKAGPDYAGFVIPDDPASSGHQEDSFQTGVTQLRPWAEKLRFVSTNHVRIFDDGPAFHFQFNSHPEHPELEVLEALAKFDPLLSELTTAIHRSRSLFPLQPQLGVVQSFPHHAALVEVLRILELRSVARMEAGILDGAADDVRLEFDLGEVFREEPYANSRFAELHLRRMAIASLWQGLARHSWRDGDLEAFQIILLRQESPTKWVNTVRMERANWVASMDGFFGAPKGMTFDIRGLAIVSMHSRLQPNILIELYWSDSIPAVAEDPWARFAFRLVPVGWIFQMKFGIVRGYEVVQKEVINQISTSSTVIGDIDTRLLGGLIQSRDGLLSLGPESWGCNYWPRLMERWMRQQILQDLAFVACGLERYRLVHGEFPTTLEALTPAFVDRIPLDRATGKSLHYTRTDNGWFRLWSVGPDGHDDGGIYRKKNGSKMLDLPWPVPVLTYEVRWF